MENWFVALSPIISAIISAICFSSLTNYRLDNLDKQVAKISNVEEKLNHLDTRVTVLETKTKQS